MSDLITFIEVRLVEDEQTARAGGWHRYELHGHEVIAAGNGRLVAVVERNYDGPHIARHDPARALREVEAKRLLLDAHPLANDPDEPPHCETCRYIADPGDPEPFPEAGYPCPTLRALAMVWAEHPDYRAEWRVA